MMTFWNNRSRRRTPAALPILLALAAFLFPAAVPAGSGAGEPPSLLLGFRGEPGDLPEDWVHVTYPFKRDNDMALLEGDDGEMVLSVRSVGAVSALLATPEAALEDSPVLRWRWKVNRAVGMAREDRRDRNDAAARVRVVFGQSGASSPQSLSPLREILGLRGIDPGPGEPGGVKIDYIWGNHVPPGTVLEYPGRRRHAVMVLQSGNEQAGRWVREERDLLRDYETCFGGRPAGIAGVLVLSDTDRTNEGVTAWFADVVLTERGDDDGP